ncbi:MAG: hypothetical protein HBSIN02_10400 [Bacteroidia bacterium]|nr:MAG: hypothetical protein HBSIN02_10400 [Bacteroidia bacterium]
MNHRDIRKLISAMVDGELDDAGTKRVNEHMASCPSCTRYARALRAVSADIRSVIPITLPDTFPLAVLRAVHAEQAESRIWMPVELFARRFVVGLGAAVVLSVALAMTIRPEEPVVAEPYLTGELSDSTATRILLTKETPSKNDLLLAVVSPE